MRKKLIITAIVFLILGTAIQTVQAVAGQWSSNGTSIYYNDGTIGLGTSTPTSGFKLQLTGGTDSTKKYNQIRLESIADRYWNVRTFPYGHSVYGHYSLVIEQPANSYSGCSGCGGDLVFMPWKNVVMRSYNTASRDFKLSVYGKVQAKEILVTAAAANWPDYVFEEGYNMMSLKETEEYINQNKKLPNVPSAKEIEENGLEVGEVQKIQMQKIEELTLYAIEQEKKIEGLEREIEELKALILAK